MKDIDKVKKNYPEFFGYLTKYIQGDINLEYLCEFTFKDNYLDMNLYTSENKYSFRYSKESNYLGCIMSKRKPLPGETWTRGHDLPDGYATEDTMIRIIGSILSLELKEIHREV